MDVAIEFASRQIMPASSDQEVKMGYAPRKSTRAHWIKSSKGVQGQNSVCILSDTCQANVPNKRYRHVSLIC